MSRVFAAVGIVLAVASALSVRGSAWQQLTARHENGYVKVADRFYLLGGRNDRPVDIFDPVKGTWSKGAPPPFEIHHFQALEYDGKVWLVGAMTGRYPAEPPIPNIYIYDPRSDTWTRGPEIPADRRRGGSGAVLYQGEIYVVAGIRNGHTDGHVTWFDAYNPKTNTWRQLPDAPHARDHFQAAVINDKLYAAGGRRSSFATNQTFQLTVPEVDVYDFKTGRWSTLPPAANIPTQRAGGAVAVVDGKLLVMGGESGNQAIAHNEVEAYDPTAGTWRTLAPLTLGRHATQAIVHNGLVYLAAGSRTRGATEVDTQEIYTPKF
jgi:N-acetylneuraminic acid mutarotase